MGQLMTRNTSFGNLLNDDLEPARRVDVEDVLAFGLDLFALVFVLMMSMLSLSYGDAALMLVAPPSGTDRRNVRHIVISEIEYERSSELAN